MAIEDIVGTVLYAAAELLGITISNDKKLEKNLSATLWVVLFLFVIFFVMANYNL